MKQRILVTGSEGFIGSHLTTELIKRGYKVRALCLYNSFNDIGWLKDLAPTILKEIEIVRGDIKDYDCVKSAMKDIDVVFNLAALIAIPYSYNAPESYIDTNIKGTMNILRAAIDNQLEQVIHTSTSEVYGTAQFVPITENHPLVGQSPYSASKIAADQLAYSYYCSFGLPVSVVRPFNTYGPRQSLRAVIPTIISQVISGNNELKLGNVDATRDFNFVQDTVNGMISFIGNAGAFGEFINLGTGVEVTIKDVVKTISQLTNVDLQIKMDEQRIRPDKSEVERLCACNKKAKNILGWSPEHNLEQGLGITLKWFENHIDNGFIFSDRYIV
ncbi:MAG: SDR family NAD(P)-dependent oxidoreductase [Alphaproteobacteria bacterium]|nr:MAG: SDR family NAD(P)-dependent oxidoreductase [Alphaproteobacteria bacterium]